MHFRADVCGALMGKPSCNWAQRKHSWVILHKGTKRDMGIVVIP